jgi:hypothetical protein
MRAMMSTTHEHTCRDCGAGTPCDGQSDRECYDRWQGLCEDCEREHEERRYLGPALWTIETDDGLVLLPPDDAELALADSLRAFDGMTIDDLAALQTTR